jgi:hypothetical protein
VRRCLSNGNVRALARERIDPRWGSVGDNEFELALRRRAPMLTPGFRKIMPLAKVLGDTSAILAALSLRRPRFSAGFGCPDDARQSFCIALSCWPLVRTRSMPSLASASIASIFTDEAAVIFLPISQVPIFE